MPYIVGDFLDDIERELVHQRNVAAREVDRADALYQLRNRALSVSADLGRAVTAKDVISFAKNEQERAELRALADRIAPPDPRGKPASPQDGEQANGSLSEQILQDQVVDLPQPEKGA
jgi:hypothetical protein